MDFNFASIVGGNGSTSQTVGAVAGGAVGAFLGVPPPLSTQLGAGLVSTVEGLFGGSGGGNVNDGKHNYIEFHRFTIGDKKGQIPTYSPTNPNWYNGTYKKQFDNIGLTVNEVETAFINLAKMGKLLKLEDPAFNATVSGSTYWHKLVNYYKSVLASSSSSSGNTTNYEATPTSGTTSPIFMFIGIFIAAKLLKIF